MHRARSAAGTHAGRAASSRPSPGNHGLAGTNWTLINRTAGNRRRLRPQRNSRTRLRRSAWPRGQLGDQIGPWRNNRTNSGLPGQRPGRGPHCRCARSSGRAGCMAGDYRTGSARRANRTWRRGRPRCDRARAQGFRWTHGGRDSRREGRTRSGQYLPGPGSRRQRPWRLRHGPRRRDRRALQWARLRTGGPQRHAARQGRTQARARSCRPRRRCLFNSRRRCFRANFGRGFNRRGRRCLCHRRGSRCRRGRFWLGRCTFYFSGRRRSAACKHQAQLHGDVLIDGTRVSLLFRHAQLRQLVDQLLRFDLELPGQHIGIDEPQPQIR